ncbi:flippase [Methanobacterium sp. ACI-7]|uniref:flippase n=1 Tax=unclassified Methanobacterium TaxID=2627676 RepID=UPI0039C467C5
MNTTKRIAKNTSYLIIASIISYVCYFFALMYMARYLGVGDFGIISLAISFTGIFGVFTDLGLNMLTAREVSRDNGLLYKYIGNTTAMKAVLSIITLILILLVTVFMGYDPKTIMVIFMITMAIVISSFFITFFSIFQALEKMQYQAIITCLDNIFMLGAVIVAINLSLDVVAIASIYLIRNLLVLAYMVMVYINKFKLPKIELDFSFWKVTIKEALPFSLSGIFLTLFIWIPSIILSVSAGQEAVGFFSAPNKLIYFFLSLYSVYMVAVFPVMSSFYKKSKNSLKFIFERSFKYTLIICAPVTVIISLLSPQIIELIYGQAYIPSSFALSILVWTIIFVSLNGISANLLGSVNRQLTMIKIIAIGIFINITAGFLLINKFSFIGASIATVITDIIVMFILLYTIIKMDYADYSLFKDIPKILTSILVMIMVIASFNGFNVVYNVSLSLIVYLITLYLIKAFDDNDILMFKRIFRIN